MLIREDLKNTIQYKNAVERYKRDVKVVIPFYMIVFAVVVLIGMFFTFLETIGIIPKWFVDILSEEHNREPIGFIYWMIILVGGEIIIFLWNICKLRNTFKVKEIFISEKKIVNGEDETFYLCYEKKKKYKADSIYLYQEIQQGKSYCFLCRGRKILEIL